MKDPNDIYPAKFKIPDDLKVLCVELTAIGELRDSYVKRPFGYKKAKKAALEFALKKVAFWKKMRILYPETQGKSWAVVECNEYIQEMK